MEAAARAVDAAVAKRTFAALHAAIHAGLVRAYHDLSEGGLAAAAAEMALALDQLLKRHFWLPTLALTSVAAFFGARGVGNLFGASLGADEKQLSATPMATKAIPVGSGGTVKATSADRKMAISE